jgi:hypothetical protein
MLNQRRRKRMILTKEKLIFSSQDLTFLLQRLEDKGRTNPNQAHSF